jgi:hypothetical protein
MIRYVFVGIAAAALAVSAASPVAAQDSLLQDLYGRGVHAFFGQQYAEAHELFTEAIDAGSRDPRNHYFRGLCLSRLGRPEESQKDFTTGAELELSADQIYNVSISLQRVQGPDRLRLERSRSTARLTIYQRDMKQKLARYEEQRQAEQTVQRKPAAPAADTTAAPATPAAEAGAEGDLFAEGKTEKAPEKPAAPAAGAAAAADDPFGDEKPAAKPAADDPFGADPAEEKPEMKEEPGAEPKGNADPFADDAGDAKPAAKPAAGEADPFADDAGDAPEMKKEDAGAAPSAKDNAKPDEEDPFGN